jgi:hypothetical protein
MKQKTSRRLKAGELTPEEARAVLMRLYRSTQQEWQTELVGENPDWVRLFHLHYELIKLETHIPKVSQ